ncbi:MAG: VOC family protein [Candidatus Delongbacteria bacterium]|nr:VOC family protein [Candidatus Delongbacteria bacterium]MBN2835962.1 VOC family protein [Candidatus Delongbacteria bacterium]
MEVLRLLVKDFDECFKFYSEKLGLKVIWGKLGDVYASFDNGNRGEIGIFKSDLMASVVGNSEEELPINCREKVMIILSVNSVDDEYNKMKSRGVDFINIPVDMPDWGMRVVHLRDSEGNLIEMCSGLLNK